MSYNTAFYCPIQVTLIPSMTIEQFMDSDYFQGDEDLPDPENPVNDALLRIVTEDIAGRRDEFHRMDGYDDIWNSFRSAKLSPVMREGAVWLKVDCATAEPCKPNRLKDYVSEVLREMAMPVGFYEIGKDLCVVELYPYEYYNQTTCAAPPSEENKVLTESEFAALSEGADKDMHAKEGIRL